MKRPSKLLQAALGLILFSGYGCVSLANITLAPPGGSSASVDPAEERRLAAEEREAERKKRADEREAEQKKRAEEEAAKEKALFDEIDATRKAIAASKDPSEKAISFAQLVLAAGNTKKAREGAVNAAELQQEAARYLEASLKKKPTLAAFDALASLPPTPDTDAKVVAACAFVRSLVPAEEVNGFVEECLGAAGGDVRKLKWKGAGQDVAAFAKAEKERKAGEAAAAEEERKEKTKVTRYMAASVFAAGPCKFSNCLTDGWRYSTPEGDIDVSCSFQNCFKDGWTARFPDGTQATTRCSFSDCMKDGWETSFSDGTTARTRCSFSNCLKDGWTTELPGGVSATTRCSFSDCTKDGWTTDLPGGKSVQCRCNFQKCFENGASCN